jgi:hypothetical protein
VDEHTLILPDDLPAGEYMVFAGMYDPQSGVRVAVQGVSVDDRVPIATLVLP